MSGEFSDFTDFSDFDEANPIRIAIFGVGLIGGSLALCFKGKPGVHVVGHSINPASTEKYVALGVVDSATTSLAEAAQDADFIFVCVPVGRLDADKLGLRGAVFIGGHPMAGSERSGVEAASYYLLENAYYVLTPTAETPPEYVGKLERLLKHTRAHIVKTDAVQHDDIVGAISHLPHIVAVALVNQIAGYNESNELYMRLAAGGFRDITRIASSDPVIWRDILLNNRDVMLKLVRDWQGEMERFAALLEREDGEGIAEQFRSAGVFRSQLPERRKGMITSLFECYVDVPDHPGIIGKIATELGQAKINLSNLQIIESREDVPGIMRLSFKQADDLDRATALLKSLNYDVHM